MGKVRPVAPPTKLGGPNAPVKPWAAMVSAMRQGVMATNTSAFDPNGKLAVAAACVPEASRSAWVGCQYNGAAQFWSITGS